jgi:cell division protein FtsW
MRVVLKKNPKKENLFYLFLLPIVLTILGLFFIFEASSISAFRNFNDSFYYFKLQSLWFIIGIAVMLFFSVFDYHQLYYLSFPALLVSIVLLILVLIPGLGHSVSGARRWIDLGIRNFQPTELAKFSVILYLCSWFLYKERKRFFSFVLLLSFLVFLIMLQPNMGTAIIIFYLFIVVYFLAGVDLHYLLFFLPTSLIIFFILIQTSSYRMRRLLAFINPELDPLGITYHVNQILISLSAGGLFGRGFGESRQKYYYLPEAHTDSIFAIIGEEFGFIGGVLLILLLFFLIYKAFSVAQNAKDRFGQLLASAIFSLLAFQVIVNLAGMVNLLPLTGVPLPFISYGGSSLLVFFALMGILINIGKR